MQHDAASLTNRAIWWAKHPKYYREFARRAKKHVTPQPARRRDEARQWCAARAVSSDEAFARLNCDLPGLAESHPGELKHAKRVQTQCPIRMGAGTDMGLAFNVARGIGAKTIVETGVSLGWSSLAFLLATQPDGRVISVDFPYTVAGSEQYVGACVPEHLRSRWTLIREADRDGIPAALRLADGVDMSHYDSDKSAAGRQWAYPLLWNALRPGGAFMSDDIGDNMAFADFAMQVGVEPVITQRGPYGYAGVLIKPE